MNDKNEFVSAQMVVLMIQQRKGIARNKDQDMIALSRRKWFLVSCWVWFAVCPNLLHFLPESILDHEAQSTTPRLGFYLIIFRSISFSK